MPKSKHLTCGCCGTWFKMWPGYRDQDQDKGYGICKQCQVDAAWQDYLKMSGIIIGVSESLSKKNRAVFDAYDRPLQEAIVYQMFEDGILTWGFARSA